VESGKLLGRLRGFVLHGDEEPMEPKVGWGLRVAQHQVQVAERLKAWQRL
jgi:hypothetical protein